MFRRQLRRQNVSNRQQSNTKRIVNKKLPNFNEGESDNCITEYHWSYYGEDYELKESPTMNIKDKIGANYVLSDWITGVRRNKSNPNNIKTLLIGIEIEDKWLEFMINIKQYVNTMIIDKKSVSINPYYNVEISYKYNTKLMYTYKVKLIDNKDNTTFLSFTDNNTLGFIIDYYREDSIHDDLPAILSFTNTPPELLYLNNKFNNKLEITYIQNGLSN